MYCMHLCVFICRSDMRSWMDGLTWQAQLTSGEVLQTFLWVLLDSLSYSHQVCACWDFQVKVCWWGHVVCRLVYCRIETWLHSCIMTCLALPHYTSSCAVHAKESFLTVQVCCQFKIFVVISNKNGRYVCDYLCRLQLQTCSSSLLAWYLDYSLSYTSSKRL